MKPPVKPRQQVAGVVRLVSASRDAEAGYLCVHRTTPDARVETYRVRIPLPKATTSILRWPMTNRR